MTLRAWASVLVVGLLAWLLIIALVVGGAQLLGWVRG